MTRASSRPVRRHALRRTLFAAAALAGVCLGGVARADGDQIARGKYLTDMGDCEGCHDAPGYPKLAGGQYMNMPFGDISTPNITPDKETGIGNYTDATFLRLMRHGVLPNGGYIYPAMPYAWYNTVSDTDLLAIKAYLFSLQPVHAPRLKNKIWFPFTIRPAIAIWDVFFVPDKRFTPDPNQSAEINRGAYIVGGLEHCGECHNNRNFLGNTDVALKYQGGPITMWYAPNILPDNATGIGQYSVDDLVSFFKYGHSEAMGPVAGPMSEVVDVSTSKLTDSDLHAIAAFLKSQKPIASYPLRTAAWRPVRYAAGQTVYLAQCASCHQDNGAGIKDKIPALDNNGMVRAFGSQDVIRVVLGGHKALGPYAVMPGLGTAMSDRDIADVTNYVRQTWSNHAPADATPLLVSLLRSDTKTLLDGKRPNGCPTLVQPQLKQILADQSNGVGTLLNNTRAYNLLQNIDAIITKVKAAAPTLAKADIVNGLTIAYCPIAENDQSVPADLRAWDLTHFADRLYVQLTTDGKY